jgi:transposase
MSIMEVMERDERKRSRARRSFTAEFKAEIVALCQRGDRSIGQVARDFDLTETAVREWVRQAERDAGTRGDGGLTSQERQELAVLRRENRRLREDVEILKRTASTNAAFTPRPTLLRVAWIIGPRSQPDSPASATVGGRAATSRTGRRRRSRCLGRAAAANRSRKGCAILEAWRACLAIRLSVEWPLIIQTIRRDPPRSAGSRAWRHLLERCWGSAASSHGALPKARAGCVLVVPVDTTRDNHGRISRSGRPYHLGRRLPIRST